jgi:hypothetical protein
VSLKWLLIPVVMWVCAWGRDAEKPRCDAQHRGELWPADVRHGEGAQQMCTLDVWRYRWEPVTVSVSQLGKERKHEERAAPRSLPVASPH